MTYSKEEKTMWLEDWQKSGKGAWTYARENGLIPQTFVTWTKKTTKEKNEFVEIKAQLKANLQTTEMVIEKGGIKIHIPLGINSADLGIVLAGLRAAV